MIELKNIPKEGRNSIICNLEYFSFLIWRKDTCLKSAHKTIIDIVGKKFEQELWVVLTHIGQAIRYGTDGYRMSFNDHHYSSANKRFNVKLSSRRMKELLCILHAEDFIKSAISFFVYFRCKNSKDPYIGRVSLTSRNISPGSHEATSISPAMNPQARSWYGIEFITPRYFPSFSALISSKITTISMSLDGVDSLRP